MAARDDTGGPVGVTEIVHRPDRVALDFPELTIIGGHIGYPWTEEAIAVATKHENVYIDTSAYTAARYPAALVEFMRAHGRHKVLFGSNYPMIAPAKACATKRAAEGNPGVWSLPTRSLSMVLGMCTQRSG